MCQPIICCYHQQSETVLLGSGDHLNLLVRNGYTDAATISDKWIFGEILVERGPTAINIVSESPVGADIKFKIEDILLKRVDSVDSFLRHVNLFGFHKALCHTLSGEAKKAMEKEHDRIVRLMDKKEGKLSDSEFDQEWLERSIELGQFFIELFQEPSNRADKWYDI